jgi:hypothetical protein
VAIAIWTHEKMSIHINRKFNNYGFFICNKIDDKYQSISFGKPFTYDDFINGIKQRKIIFDSGMYNGNTRNYSSFRSSGVSFWNDLIVEVY